MILDERNRRAGIQADVKGLVPLEDERHGVLHGLFVHFLAVHVQHAGAAFAEAAAVKFEVKFDRVFAGLEFRAFPGSALQIEQVVEKHRLSPADSHFAFAQEQVRSRRTGRRR